MPLFPGFVPREIITVTNGAGGNLTVELNSSTAILTFSGAIPFGLNNRSVDVLVDGADSGLSSTAANARDNGINLSGLGLTDGQEVVAQITNGVVTVTSNTVVFEGGVVQPDPDDWEVTATSVNNWPVPPTPSAAAGYAIFGA